MQVLCPLQMQATFERKQAANQGFFNHGTRSFVPVDAQENHPRGMTWFPAIREQEGIHTWLCEHIVS